MDDLLEGYSCIGLQSCIVYPAQAVKHHIGFHWHLTAPKVQTPTLYSELNKKAIGQCRQTLYVCDVMLEFKLRWQRS